MGSEPFYSFDRYKLVHFCKALIVYETIAHAYLYAIYTTDDLLHTLFKRHMATLYDRYDQDMICVGSKKTLAYLSPPKPLKGNMCLIFKLKDNLGTSVDMFPDSASFLTCINT